MSQPPSGRASLPTCALTHRDVWRHHAIHEGAPCRPSWAFDAMPASLAVLRYWGGINGMHDLANNRGLPSQRRCGAWRCARASLVSDLKTRPKNATEAVVEMGLHQRPPCLLTPATQPPLRSQNSSEIGTRLRAGAVLQRAWTNSDSSANSDRQPKSRAVPTHRLWSGRPVEHQHQAHTNKMEPKANMPSLAKIALNIADTANPLPMTTFTWRTRRGTTMFGRVPQGRKR